MSEGESKGEIPSQEETAHNIELNESEKEKIKYFKELKDRNNALYELVGEMPDNFQLDGEDLGYLMSSKLNRAILEWIGGNDLTFDESSITTRDEDGRSHAENIISETRKRRKSIIAQELPEFKIF